MARARILDTGSPLDMPAKTLKAGDHGVPGGENMMVRENGKLRYFSVRDPPGYRPFRMVLCFMGLGPKPCDN